MNRQQLRTFLAVLEHGSFSRAAEALRLSQSTVSFQVRALEEDAGAPLVRRGARARPTASGQLLARYARRLLDLEEEARARVRETGSGSAGELRIAASSIPAAYLLPPAIARLREERPLVRIVVAASDSRRAVASLAADECDLALVGARPADRRLVPVAFAEDEVVLVGPPGAPRSVGARALGALPLVAREEGSGTGEAVAALLARHGARPSVIAGSAEAAKRCVLAGVGYAFLSRHSVEEELAAGAVARVAFPGSPVRRSFWVVRRRDAAPSPAGEALLRLLGRTPRYRRPRSR